MAMLEVYLFPVLLCEVLYLSLTKTTLLTGHGHVTFQNKDTDNDKHATGIHTYFNDHPTWNLKNMLICTLR